MSVRSRILCIDDNNDILDLIEISLSESSDLELRICNSAIDAFGIIKHWSPDLILLDIVMPYMDGLEALRRMRNMSILKTVPIVIISARVEGRQIDEYMSLGAQSVIKKPFEPMGLGDAIREILGVSPGGRTTL